MATELLIAEDLLLLLLDDESGALPTSAPVSTVVGGALLVDLAGHGLVEIKPAASRWRRATVSAGEPVPGGHPLPEDGVLVILDAAVAIIEEKPRAAQDLVDRLGKQLRDPLIQRLVDRGIVRREESKVLGLFPRTRWPEADGAHEAALRRQLEAVLLHDQPADQPTAALVALLSAVRRVEATLGRDRLREAGRTGRGVRRRAEQVAEQLAEGDWAAQAVKDAVAAAASVVTTTAVAAATVATTSTIT